MRWIYLDNNATTQPADEVLAAMDEAQRTLWANPSSVHRFGQQVRQKLELARQSVAQLINARPRELIFTSGGTEANNLALRGLLDAELFRHAASPTDTAPTLITTPIEHAAIREPAEAVEQLGGRVVRLDVSRAGLLDLDELAAALDEAVECSAAGHPAPVLLSIQWANNETGVIQPIAAIGELVRQRREAARSAGHRLKLHFHVDATQAVGKLPVDVVAAGVDLLTLSGHKFHGPKGVGALFVRSGVRLRAVNRGGPQEREKRGGTENTAGIIGLGVAAELARGFVNDGEAVARCRALRDRFEAGVRAAVPEVVVNSRDPTPGVPGGGGLSAQDSRLRTQDSRLWNTSNLAFAGLEAEAILLGLSEQGLCASAGAACSSGSLEPSPVLRAMGIDEPTAHGSVRFSLSRYTTRQEIDEAVALVPRVVARLGRTMPVGG